ncbi:platelet binding protein GspB-like [Littorina saxatilis]
MVYYRWLHPSGPNYLFTVKSTLPATQSQRSQSPKERRRPQAANITADSPNGNGSTLELSIESETPAREQSQQARGGNTTLSQLLHSASRGALESAWQSGMQSSSSSSSSSLDADDCSLDAFNLTSKSSHSTTLLGKSRSSQNTSQSKVSSSTVKSRRSDSATAQPQQHTTGPPANLRGPHFQSASSSVHVVDSGQPSSVHVVDSGQPSSPSVISERSETGSVRERFHSGHSNQSEAPSASERVSESEQQELLNGVLREEADGTEAVAESLTPTNRSRSRLSGNRSNLSTSFFDQASGGSLHEHNQSALALSRVQGERGTAASRLEPVTAHNLSTELRMASTSLSPLDISRLWSESQSRLGHSSASDVVPADRTTRRADRLSRSFELGESRMMSPDCAGQASGDRVTSRSASFRQSERESMAPYPDLVEPMSPEPQEGYGGGAGGESMWSPNLSTNNTSTSSSSHGQDPGLSAPARLSRLVDSFDSESEPVCLNTMNLQALRSTGGNSPLQRQIENRRLEQLKRSLAAESPSSNSSMSPVVKDDSGETSWTSLNVNEDELSGLQNLNSLTPDDSICSFASSDRDERRRPTPAAAHQVARGVQQQGTESGITSGASTPSLPRSRSTSSLYHDFTSAGVSPSPPPGLRAAARLSRNQSWVDSPSQQREQLADTPMRLDYLNLDPAPPVEPESYFQRHDPREVVIELLMDQLKRASLRSNHSRTESAHLSPLTMSHLQESPQRFGRNVDLFDRQAWRSLFGQDPNSTLVSNPEPPRRRSVRTDLDLMREALDLIEMQRSPYSFRRGTGTPDSASPEMYVSGQYRPPIIAQEREQAARGSVPPLVRGRERRQSHSRLEESLIHAAAVDKSSSLPRQTPAYRPDQTRQAPVVPSEMDSRRRSLPAGEREGLYRYFVDSDSPIHTPLWNTPLTTPAVTPAQRHLLQRYLANNHVASAPRDGRLPSTEARSLREANIEAARLSTTLPHDQLHRRSASRRLSDKLDTAADHPDSGMHSGSQSSASHRQPLQSLDNSPSLSPSSSVTQLPVRAKPTSQQFAMTKSSAGRARSSSGTRRSSGAVVSSGQPSQGDRQGSPKQKHSSVRPRPHPAYRHGDRRSATDFSASQGPVSSRAKSSDCLR